jgi:DNA-binding GntR family transcriptional regulator
VTTAPMDADYTPRYIRLAKLLRGWIEDGTYPPGSLLPSATRLAELHTVSKATARHALEVLVKSGHARHVESKPHQVIWRQAGLNSPDSAVGGLTI